MKNFKMASAVIMIIIMAALGVWFITRKIHPSSQIKESESGRRSEQFIGTSSCRECHEKFYQLWAPSHHGLAMQLFSADLARTQLSAQESDIEIGDYRYRVEVEAGEGVVRENGPEGDKEYRIEYVLGGKYVYYFLTLMERGRLQVLPLAYDTNEKVWYDTTASMVRHAARLEDEALNWKDQHLTFNTSCYSCHISQLSTNYDLKTDTYRTTWAEPGINCETCHGGGSEHVRVFREASEGHIPEDTKIIRVSTFSSEQLNAMCAPCHAKMTSLTSTFQPGDRYFDHFTLAAFENPDFFPDGRDLGENYTYTLWLTSPCVKSGQLDCLHCHTSSGRYRFKEKQSNNACMPCHAEHVANAPAHSHHPADSESSRCISCHMPKTKYARMWRSDHSMRPPTPSVTLLYESPNACNICHADRDAAWSDKYVREWRSRDFQAPVLHLAGLIDAARKRDWTRLDDMLAYLTSEEHDEVFSTSLIRLLRLCDDEKKWPIIVMMLNDPSPLVRASAAESLTDHLTPRTVEALLKATQDDYRLVRISTAASLAGYPEERLGTQTGRNMDRVMAEFEESMQVRPDAYASHYNLGNFYMDRNDITRAIASFENAIRLQPNSVLPLVNASIAYARGGRSDRAEELLRRALLLEPENPVANLNLGLLLGEQGRIREAERVLRVALNSEPNLAAAAYNLGIILAENHIEETLVLCRRAYQLNPEESKYAYTLAFYLNQTGNYDGAIPILKRMVDRKTANANSYFLLGEIFERQGKIEEAMNVYREAVANEKLSQDDRAVFAAKLRIPSII
ncbi:MAG: tetratricopeptide repeat protein [Candidatus Aminicenantes bacterium]|nr:tetratricopeptide repeat protein [Candidatus Aminicenantes bacterium]